MTNNLKLFASDMDGTFLRSDRSFDKNRLRELLVKFDRKQLIFCAASGRQLLALEEMFAEFKNQMAFVAENGGIVSYQGEIIFAEALTFEQLNSLATLLQQMPDSPQQDFLVSGLRGAYALDGVNEDFFSKAQLYYANCQKVANLDEIDDTPLKITTNFPPERVRQCEDWLNAQVPYIRATTTGFSSIDIIPAGVSKATGLKKLLAHFGWSADNLAAFGDQMNDYEMLQYAGQAFAVSNALAPVQAIADQIILSNDQDAVLVAIEKILSE